jgi:hypothetical protein
MGIEPTSEGWVHWKCVGFNLCRDTHTAKARMKAYARVVRSDPPGRIHAYQFIPEQINSPRCIVIPFPRV